MSDERGFLISGPAPSNPCALQQQQKPERFLHANRKYECDMSLTFQSLQWLPVALRMKCKPWPASLPAPAPPKDLHFREEPAL